VAASATAGEADPGSGVCYGCSPEDEAAGGTDEDGSNTADGTSCFSLNPLTVLKCALRWAFVPTTLGSQWDDLYANLQTKPPFSVVTAAGGFVADEFALVKTNYDIANLADASSQGCISLELPDSGIPAEDVCFVPQFVALAGSSWLVGTLRTMAGVLLAVATFVKVYRIFKSALTSAPEDPGGELQDQEVSERDG
jgi:hypothetical protein